MDPLSFPLAPHVGEVLSLARIYGQIFGSRVFAHDHPLINVFLRSNEKPAALLDVIERVSHADSRFHRDHHAASASANLAFERCVFAKKVTHQSFAPGQVDEIGFEADQPAGRNDRLNGNPRLVMRHADDFAFAIGNRLQNVA